MTWIRLDADMPWHEKIIALPNDTARFAFVKMLCAAKVRGRSSFSPESLREMLGTHAKAISQLIAAGLLDQDGTRLVVHDFEDYQRKALQAERQQRHRGVTGALPERDISVTEASPTGRDSTGRNGTPPFIPPTTTMMGWRPRLTQADALVDIERQHAASLADAVAKAKARE